jgi:hypothetical protein
MTKKRTGSELVARHAELVGRVTLMWSDVHAQVGQLFEDFCASKIVRKRYWETQAKHLTAPTVLRAAYLRRLTLPLGSPYSGLRLRWHPIGPRQTRQDAPESPETALRCAFWPASKLRFSA